MDRSNFKVGDYVPDISPKLFPEDHFPEIDFENNPGIKEKFERILNAPLSWNQMFKICNDFRLKANIPPMDFVVLLTKRRNSLNFFSVFEEEIRNAFIQISDWELFTNAPMKFPVAYKVWSNILGKLMGMKFSTEQLSEFYHINAIGCMNDFCQNKSEVVLKLRTADICDKCIGHLKNKNVPNEVILQALSLFEKVRKDIMFSQGFSRNLIAYPILVQGKKIIINDKELKLQPISKAMYIFYLNHLEGIRVAELGDYKKELKEIYLKIRPGGDPKSILDITKLVDGTFDYNKSRLNKQIKDQFDERMANFYIVDGQPGEKFKINIEPSLVRISD